MAEVGGNRCLDYHRDSEQEGLVTESETQVDTTLGKGVAEHMAKLLVKDRWAVRHPSPTLLVSRPTTALRGRVISRRDGGDKGLGCSWRILCD
jgi:hypothetical protein